MVFAVRPGPFAPANAVPLPVLVPAPTRAGPAPATACGADAPPTGVVVVAAAPVVAPAPVTGASPVSLGALTRLSAGPAAAPGPARLARSAFGTVVPHAVSARPTSAIHVPCARLVTKASEIDQ